MQNYERVFGLDEDYKIRGIKKSLVEGNPVVIGTLIERSFFIELRFGHLKVVMRSIHKAVMRFALSVKMTTNTAV